MSLSISSLRDEMASDSTSKFWQIKIAAAFGLTSSDRVRHRYLDQEIPIQTPLKPVEYPAEKSSISTATSK